MNYDLEREILMRRCNKIMVCMSFLFASALAGCSQKDIESASNDLFQADQTESIIHESVDISYYDIGNQKKEKIYGREKHNYGESWGNCRKELG